MHGVSCVGVFLGMCLCLGVCLGLVLVGMLWFGLCGVLDAWCLVGSVLCVSVSMLVVNVCRGSVGFLDCICVISLWCIFLVLCFFFILLLVVCYLLCLCFCCGLDVKMPMDHFVGVGEWCVLEVTAEVSQTTTRTRSDIESLFACLVQIEGSG